MRARQRVYNAPWRGRRGSRGQIRCFATRGQARRGQVVASSATPPTLPEDLATRTARRRRACWTSPARAAVRRWARVPPAEHRHWLYVAFSERLATMVLNHYRAGFAP